MATQHARGLFVGMTTLDCIYQAERPPAANEKLVADKGLMVAGGPATNAAVAFAQLRKGNQAVIASAVGQHAITTLIREDLAAQNVSMADLTPQRTEAPPVSSIVVSAESGDRAVISRNAVDAQLDPSQLDPSLLSTLLEDTNIILIDGHQMLLSAHIAQQAKAQNIPLVIDGGSWKPGFETVLPLADVVIASANFWPPDCGEKSAQSGEQAVMDYLQRLGVARVAITRGSAPILYRDGNESGELPVPQVRAVDTLGAGDIFHGAFCHFYLTHTYEETLLKASRTASWACQHWGTRDWTRIYRMDHIDDEDTSDVLEPSVAEAPLMDEESAN